MEKFRSAFAQHRLLGGALVLALTQFGASFVGLIRDRLLASTFPHLGVVDVYVASFRPSDLLFQIGIMSAMGTVLVPILAAHKANDRRQDMFSVLTSTTAMGTMLFGTLALALALALPFVAKYLVAFSGAQLELYIRFARFALLINFLFVAGNAFGQFLITEQKYWIYGITPILYTLGTIGGTLWLTPHFGPSGPIIGTLIGAIVYVILRFIAVLRATSHKPQATSFRWWHPDLRHMGLLMLPRMAALGALQLQLLFFDTIASGLDQGSITINAFTRNFQGVIVGIAGIALAQSAYSLLSQAAARGEMERFRVYIHKCLAMLLWTTIPLSALLVLAAPIAAWVVHLQGVLHPFVLCLALYAISVPFESINHLFLRGFYALKDTINPAIWGTITGGLAVVIAWTMAPTIGIFALPFGYAVTQVVETVVLGTILMKKIECRNPRQPQGERAGRRG